MSRRGIPVRKSRKTDTKVAHTKVGYDAVYDPKAAPDDPP
ncbi:unnamed protein product [marine sediment metagenome]|uniref:Uncharacterized protein n=1 Tax=marine sediment metagenome TaxID=412755 RepID=X1VY26_9ZZZZ